MTLRARACVLAIATYDDLQSHDLDLAGVRVRLATPETLYRMKRDTVRPIDRIDAEVLKDALARP